MDVGHVLLERHVLNHELKTLDKISNLKLVTTKPGHYVNQYVKPYICTQFYTFNLKIESRSVKIDRLVKWSIVRILNEAEPS